MFSPSVQISPTALANTIIDAHTRGRGEGRADAESDRRRGECDTVSKAPPRHVRVSELRVMLAAAMNVRPGRVSKAALNRAIAANEDARADEDGLIVIGG